MLSAVRNEVAGAAPGVRLYSVRVMDDVIDRSLAARRFNLSLLGMFAAAAVVLAACGLYGVLAYAVTQRWRELAIRMALGASRGAVVALVLQQGAGIAFTGMILGIAGALTLSRAIAGMLYGVGARDPLTLATVATVLGCVALIAAYLPARRAAHADPMVTLRED
jgi:putative ABC transport system permease protein